MKVTIDYASAGERHGQYGPRVYDFTVSILNAGLVEYDEFLRWSRKVIDWGRSNYAQRYRWRMTTIEQVGINQWRFVVESPYGELDVEL